VQAETPINLGNKSDVFHHIDKETCILYVLHDSKMAYQQANQWIEFENVMETS
jgi:hypothetical protein